MRISLPSSSKSKAASADRIAAFAGAMVLSCRISSVVLFGFRRPKCRREVSIASWSNSSSSKTFRREGNWGGVEWGAIFGARSPEG
jgi:hypothetical protein